MTELAFLVCLVQVRTVSLAGMNSGPAKVAQIARNFSNELPYRHSPNVPCECQPCQVTRGNRLRQQPRPFLPDFGFRFLRFPARSRVLELIWGSRSHRIRLSYYRVL